MGNIIIAIDGPAASGKSTVAKNLATLLNYNYLDTGAMYRCMTLFVLENNIDPLDEKTNDKYVEKVSVEIDGPKSYLNGKDVSDVIRNTEVTKWVSTVCAYRSVRFHMVDEQRRMAAKGNKGVILDGRDIGSNVFPNADVKFYLTASYDVRAQRRFLENQKRGMCDMTLDELKEDLIRRDKADSSRPIAPLTIAKDAIIIDNTNLNIEETTQCLLNIIKEKVHELS